MRSKGVDIIFWESAANMFKAMGLNESTKLMKTPRCLHGQTEITLENYSQLSRSNTKRTANNLLHSYFHTLAFILALTQFSFHGSSKVVEEFPEEPNFHRFL